MDRETVIESAIEIATHGAYEDFARSQLREELLLHGYSCSDVGVAVEACRLANRESDMLRFANVLFDVLDKKQTSNRYLNDPSMLYALCVLQK